MDISPTSWPGGHRDSSPWPTAERVTAHAPFCLRPVLEPAPERGQAQRGDARDITRRHLSSGAVEYRAVARDCPSELGTAHLFQGTNQCVFAVTHRFVTTGRTCFTLDKSYLKMRFTKPLGLGQTLQAKFAKYSFVAQE